MAIPTPHTVSAAAEYFVDASGGNDSNDGSSGSPWLTIQGALNKLRDTVSWPASGDVLLKIRQGTYRATSGESTANVSFNNTNRRPKSDRFFVIMPDGDSEVIVQPPQGATGAKYGFKFDGNESTFWAGYTIVDGLIVDGLSTRLGNNDVTGFYMGAFGSSPSCEIKNCTIRSLQSFTKAQAIYNTNNGTNLLIWNNIIYDIGTGDVAIDGQEHGIYNSAHDVAAWNNVLYEIPNGFAIQWYRSAAVINNGIICHNTIAGTVEKSGVVIHGGGTGNRINNNIIRDTTEYGIQFFPASFGGSDNEFRYNVCYNCALGSRSHASPAGWTIDNILTSDPMHVNPGSRIYTLQTGSPAIGLSDGANSPSADILGVSRA